MSESIADPSHKAKDQTPAKPSTVSWRDQPHSHRSIYRVLEISATFPQSYLPCPGETSNTPTDLSTVSWRYQPHSHRAIYRVLVRPATLPRIYLPCFGETSNTPTELSTVSWRDQPHSHGSIYRVLERPATLPQIYLPCPGKTSHTPTELSAVSWTDQPLSPTDLLERPATLSQIYVLNRPATLPRIYVLKRPVPLPQIYLPCPGETSHTPTDLSTMSSTDQPHSHRSEHGRSTLHATRLKLHQSLTTTALTNEPNMQTFLTTSTRKGLFTLTEVNRLQCLRYIASAFLKLFTSLLEI